MAVELSLIVPARGNAAELNACLQSLKSQNTQAEYETLVVFCERDNEVNDIVKNHSFVRAIHSPDYLFPGAARNLGAEHARAEILAFIDSDCIVDSSWVGAALQTIRAGAVLCGGAILDAHPWHMLAASDNRLQYADFPRGRPRGAASYFPAAHLAIRREAYHLIGGFPNSQFAQDVLFTAAVAKRFPNETIFNPALIVRHHGRRGWRNYLEHHRIFGRARAQYGILLNPSMRWLVRHPSLGWLILLRRLAYITLRVAQWNTRDLFRYFLQLPLLIAGLTAWTIGFYQGMQKDAS